MLIQLELFEELGEMELMGNKIKEIEEGMHRVRRGIYAKHGELSKCYLDIHQRLEVIEKFICRGK